MDVKINLRIITKNHAADPEIGFLTKSISKANGYGTAMPPAWELNPFILTLIETLNRSSDRRKSKNLN